MAVSPISSEYPDIFFFTTTKVTKKSQLGDLPPGPRSFGFVSASGKCANNLVVKVPAEILSWLMEFTGVAVYVCGFVSKSITLKLV